MKSSVSYGPPGKIDIRCEGSFTLGLDEMTEFQGQIKTHNVEWIAQSIIENGFCAPFFIWKNNGQNNCLDGHGRLKALKHLQDAGWEIPALQAGASC